MIDRLLFLGGASVSGKTTAGAALARALGLHCVHLDQFHDPLHHANRAQTIDRDLSVKLTRSICHSVVENFLANGAAGVIEGSWLTVPQASALMSDRRFVPLFCGYPEADVTERWRQMLASPGPHWLKTYDDPGARAWIERQIRQSADYRDECERHGVAFVDCSDLATATADIVAAMQDLLR